MEEQECEEKEEEEWEEEQAWVTLTTGLARAELALEEARELELRPLCSEGCTQRRQDRQKQNRSEKQQEEAHLSQELQTLRLRKGGRGTRGQHSREGASLTRSRPCSNPGIPYGP